MQRTFYEFFAGGGLVRAGLERTSAARWRCALANDVSPEKCAAYRANWGDAELIESDVAALTPDDAPGRADLAWASFPCQDLSLAGPQAGLGGARSGVFWSFWSLIRRLDAEGRGPRLIALENVAGLLASRGGRDFADLCAALAGSGRRVGALIVDAAHFVPQSRPRLIVLAGPTPPKQLIGGPPTAEDAARHWGEPAVAAAVRALSEPAESAWVWLRPPPPPRRNMALGDLLEPGAAWAPTEKTERLLTLLGPVHRAKLARAHAASRADGRARHGAAFRRTRTENSLRVQRLELRFDGLAGCLRTPAGGSSRQFLVETRASGAPRSRLLTPRECARLMGLDDTYALPSRATDAFRLTGDGVAAPVAHWLADTLLEPWLAACAAPAVIAAE